MVMVEPEAGAQRFESLVLDFLAYLEFERGLSRNTLEAYRSDLLQFGRYLEAGGLSALTVTTVEVSGWLSRLADPAGGGASPATVHRKAACLRSFFRHLRRESLRESDPTSTLSAPRRGRRLPQVLTRPEVARLLEHPRGTEPAALRDRAILEVMYACGLRASEAVDLDVTDVDLDAGVLRALSLIHI